MNDIASLSRTKPAVRYYMPELDGLRMCAFLAVFIVHGLPWDLAFRYRVGGEVAELIHAAIRSGAFGVDLFFCLSAFLITQLLLRERRARGRIDVRAFYLRRILRIWPLYYTFLLLTTVVFSRVIERDHLPPNYVITFSLLAGNWSCALHNFPDSVAGILWSVSIEEQFYLLWPLVMRTTSRNRLWLFSGAMLVTSSMCRVLSTMQHLPYPGTWCNTLCRLDPIALGIMIALATERRLPRLSPLRRGALLLGGIACWVIVSRWLPIIEAPPRFHCLAAYPLVSLGSAAMLVSALGNHRGLLATRPIMYLGRISYGLYVFHTLSLRLTYSIAPPHSRPLLVFARFALAAIITVALAALSYRLLERPFLRLKERFTYVSSRPA